MAPTSPRGLRSSSPISEPDTTPSLSLSSLPPLYVLPTHFSNDELFIFEEKLAEHEAPVTYDVSEAKIFLSKILQPKRAALELRSKGLWTEPSLETIAKTEESKGSTTGNERPSKRRKLRSASTSTSSSTATRSSSSDRESNTAIETTNKSGLSKSSISVIPELKDEVMVVKVEWLIESAEAGKILPAAPYVVYKARPTSKLKVTSQTAPIPKTVTYIKVTRDSSKSSGASKEHPEQRLPRTQEDATTLSLASAYNQRRTLGGNASGKIKPAPPPKLHRTTTSEFEGQENITIPEPPDWVKKNEIYACRRSTFPNPPNAAFIGELQKIKKARTLTLDEIGERAYATSIASISAYPYRFSHPKEILQLPGCDTRIATLWSEWRASAERDEDRFVPAARALEQDEHLKILATFYEIWGVGADTARKFYFTRGWKEIDDIVEFGWNELTRVQQIGVKYLSEFGIGIPRPEVEHINSIVLSHARKCHNIPGSAHNTDTDFVSIIVGGYRRGKPLSGDVDIILTHRSESYTRDLIIPLVQSLEQSNYITHTLTLNTTTSSRDQQTLPFRSSGHAGHGFDSLDKALCVWQTPNFDSAATTTTTTTTTTKTKTQNPNLHRRVDIIISPYKTIGCAVLGWSGATTFERDVRRWAKKEHFWKFDSSGIRDRGTGRVVDLEGGNKDAGAGAGGSGTWEEREKRVMEGLGIGWRPPTERWTG